MSTTITVEAFLQEQPTRYEFDRFRVFTITGGSANHATVQLNLVNARNEGAAGLGWQCAGTQAPLLIQRLI
jgi:hypothetical protein